MYVSVNGTRLFFDVVGAKLALADGKLLEKPTLIVLHGGPGLDHVMFRPHFDRYADIAQVIYIDQRGNGRSTGSSPESWTLAQWGDDVRALCDQLGIERPVVFGNSFGGFVAQSYATRHPAHPAGLILSSTAAKTDLEASNERIEQAGGPEARAAAEQVWARGDAEAYVGFNRLVAPLFMSAGGNPWSEHAIRTYEVVGKFHRPPGGEIRTFDFRKALSKVQCPTLVLTGGSGDLITPSEVAREMADCLPQRLVRFECLPHGRHGVFRDDPEATDRIIRSFMADVAKREAASRRHG